MVEHVNRVTHFIPPAKRMQDVEREFVEPSASDHFIHWLFRYRCASCKGPGQEINEIVPRGRSKNSILDWKNRILLCRTCHEKFHHDGVTNEKIKAMQDVRKNYLTLIGRTEYLNG